MGARGITNPGGGFKLAGRSRRSGLCNTAAEKEGMTMESSLKKVGTSVFEAARKRQHGVKGW
jgi:hypothetical protein